MLSKDVWLYKLFTCSYKNAKVRKLILICMYHNVIMFTCTVIIVPLITISVIPTYLVSH